MREFSVVLLVRDGIRSWRALGLTLALLVAFAHPPAAADVSASDDSLEDCCIKFCEGKTAFDQGRFEDARVRLGTLLEECAEDATWYTWGPMALELLGCIAWQSDDYEAALKHFEDALSATPGSDQSRAACLALRRGLVLHDSGELELAVRECEQVLGEFYHGRWGWKRYPSFEPNLDLYERVFERVMGNSLWMAWPDQDEEWFGVLLYQLARSYLHQGRYAEAQSVCFRYLSGRHYDTGDEEGSVLYLARLAGMNLRPWIYKDTYVTGLGPGARGPMEEYANGVFAAYGGMYVGAQGHLSRALKLCQAERRDAEGRASTRASSHWPNRLSPPGEIRALILGDLAQLAVRMADYGRAATYAAQASEVYRTMGWGGLAAEMKAGAKDLKRMALAEEALSLPESERADVSSCPDEFNDPLLRGRYALAAGMHEAAVAHFREALDPSSMGSGKGPPASYSVGARLIGGGVSRSIAANTGLGRALEGAGMYEEARIAYMQAIEQIEAMREWAFNGESVRYLMEPECLFPRLDAYEGVVRVLVEMGKDKEAFYWSERVKARVLLDKIASASRLETPSEATELTAQLQELQRELTCQEEEMVFSTETSEQENAFRQYRETESRIDDCLRELYAQAESYVLSRYPKALTADELALGPNEMLLAYEVTDDELIVFRAWPGGSVTAEAVAVTRAELGSMIRDFRDDLRYPGGWAESRALYDLLLAPYLPNEDLEVRVLVVPDEELWGLPLEGLLTGPSPVRTAGRWSPDITEVRYVQDLFDFSYWASGSVMTTVRKLHRKSTTPRLLVLADPVLAEGDERLPWYESVNKRLSEEFGEEGVTVLSCTEANESSFLDEEPGDYRYLAFFTHGVLKGTTAGEGGPALVLSDGYLTFDEILGLPVVADAVGLMACLSASGDVIPGEGIMSLAYAFQGAGARSVLASLWKVQRPRAQPGAPDVVMAEFFCRLRQGESTLSALHNARQQLRRTTATAHPAYWAAFVLIGD